MTTPFLRERVTVLKEVTKSPLSRNLQAERHQEGSLHTRRRTMRHLWLLCRTEGRNGTPDSRVKIPRLVGLGWVAGSNHEWPSRTLRCSLQTLTRARAPVRRRSFSTRRRSLSASNHSTFDPRRRPIPASPPTTEGVPRRSLLFSSQSSWGSALGASGGVGAGGSQD
jgi:hypothetical protein